METPAAVARIHRVLQSRRMQERFFHLRFYEGEPPARSLLAGIELTEAARRHARGRP